MAGLDSGGATRFDDSGVGTLGGALRAAVEAATPMSLGSTTSLLVVSVVGIVALVFDLGGRALPSVQRQVNEDWLVEFRGWVYGFGFGAQLGAGVATSFKIVELDVVASAADDGEAHIALIAHG